MLCRFRLFKKIFADLAKGEDYRSFLDWRTKVQLFLQAKLISCDNCNALG